ncbi:hypothetical protein, partial [Salmonella sp. s58408]|uniref:hypothetical protein n=1 Tax=Salmonella sp. s58408 TaxID=3159701 RepID=UPI00397F8BAE
DVARHQHHQQQIGGAPSAGIGCFPTGVEVVRNGMGGAVWRGPRMQRRNINVPAAGLSWAAAGSGKDPETKPAPAEKMEAASGSAEGTQEGSAPAADPATATESP